MSHLICFEKQNKWELEKGREERAVEWERVSCNGQLLLFLLSHPTGDIFSLGVLISYLDLSLNSRAAQSPPRQADTKWRRHPSPNTQEKTYHRISKSKKNTPRSPVWKSRPWILWICSITRTCTCFWPTSRGQLMDGSPRAALFRIVVDRRLMQCHRFFGHRLQKQRPKGSKRKKGGERESPIGCSAARGEANCLTVWWWW